MPTTLLEIAFEGDAPGLREHRLSLGQFGPALEILLRALRRTASNMLADALGEADRGARGGRLKAEAASLDLQILGVREGCVTVQMQPVINVPHAANLELFAGLEERATRQLLEDIQSESQGHFRNALARNFLRALPQGVHSQRYSLTRDGAALFEARIGGVELVEETAPLPTLVQITGAVVGVTFPPARPEVRLQAAGETTILRAEANAAQVERAIDLRAATVDALLVLEGRRYRLLWVRGTGQPKVLGDPDRRRDAVMSRWSDLLERLS